MTVNSTFVFDASILSRNLDTLMKKEKISANSLANIIGIPATSIKRIRSNAQPNPTLATLLPLANYFNVSLNQLIGLASLENVINQSDAVGYSPRKIPVLNWSIAYKWPNIDLGTLKIEYVNVVLAYIANCYALKIEEELGRFAKGSILIVVKKEKIQHGDHIVVVKSDQTKASLKLALLEDEEIYIKSLTIDIPAVKFSNDYIYLGTIIQSIWYF